MSSVPASPAEGGTLIFALVLEDLVLEVLVLEVLVVLLRVDCGNNKLD
jgi:hypothetical protein